jgi:acyl dehydratase
MYIVSLLRGNKSAEDHEFRPDGMYCDEVPGTEGLDVALMAGGQEVRWHLPLPLGEPIEMERRLVSVDRKGRGGNPFLLLTVEKSYTTARGRLIAGVTERFIVR